MVSKILLVCCRPKFLKEAEQAYFRVDELRIDQKNIRSRLFKTGGNPIK